MNDAIAREITRWYYPPPYDIYNLVENEATIGYAVNPKNNFFALEDEQGKLVGFCSFGKDGQVPGGDYCTEALDIGLGLRPDLTGRGRGIEYVKNVLVYAQKMFNPIRFRVTIAAFNKRAQKVWRKAGFDLVGRFQHEESRREFVILLRDTMD